MRENFSSYYETLKEEIQYFDKQKTGFITFSSFRNVLEKLQIQLDNEIIEYLIFVMKSFNNEGSSYSENLLPSLYDLKYDNFLENILNDNNNNNHSSFLLESQVNNSRKAEMVVEPANSQVEALAKHSNSANQAEVNTNEFDEFSSFDEQNVRESYAHLINKIIYYSLNYENLDPKANSFSLLENNFGCNNINYNSHNINHDNFTRKNALNIMYECNYFDTFAFIFFNDTGHFSSRLANDVNHNGNNNILRFNHEKKYDFISNSICFKTLFLITNTNEYNINNSKEININNSWTQVNEIHDKSINSNKILVQAIEFFEFLKFDFSKLEKYIIIRNLGIVKENNLKIDFFSSHELDKKYMTFENFVNNSKIDFLKFKSHLFEAYYNNSCTSLLNISANERNKNIKNNFSENKSHINKTEHMLIKDKLLLEIIDLQANEAFKNSISKIKAAFEKIAVHIFKLVIISIFYEVDSELRSLQSLENNGNKSGNNINNSNRAQYGSEDMEEIIISVLNKILFFQNDICFSSKEGNHDIDHNPSIKISNNEYKSLIDLFEFKNILNKINLIECFNQSKPTLERIRNNNHVNYDINYKENHNSIGFAKEENLIFIFLEKILFNYNFNQFNNCKNPNYDENNRHSKDDTNKNNDTGIYKKHLLKSEIKEIINANYSHLANIIDLNNHKAENSKQSILFNVLSSNNKILSYINTIKINFKSLSDLIEEEMRKNSFNRTENKNDFHLIYNNAIKEIFKIKFDIKKDFVNQLLEYNFLEKLKSFKNIFDKDKFLLLLNNFLNRKNIEQENYNFKKIENLCNNNTSNSFQANKFKNESMQNLEKKNFILNQKHEKVCLKDLLSFCKEYGIVKKPFVLYHSLPDNLFTEDSHSNFNKKEILINKLLENIYPEGIENKKMNSNSECFHDIKYNNDTAFNEINTMNMSLNNMAKKDLKIIDEVFDNNINNNNYNNNNSCKKDFSEESAPISIQSVFRASEEFLKKFEKKPSEKHIEKPIINNSNRDIITKEKPDKTNNKDIESIHNIDNRVNSSTISYIKNDNHSTIEPKKRNFISISINTVEEKPYILEDEDAYYDNFIIRSLETDHKRNVTESLDLNKKFIFELDNKGILSTIINIYL